MGIIAFDRGEPICQIVEEGGLALAQLVVSIGAELYGSEAGFSVF